MDWCARLSQGNRKLVPTFQKCPTHREAGWGGQGPLGLVFLEGFSNKVLKGVGRESGGESTHLLSLSRVG